MSIYGNSSLLLVVLLGKLRNKATTVNVLMISCERSTYNYDVFGSSDWKIMIISL